MQKLFRTAGIIGSVLLAVLVMSPATAEAPQIGITVDGKPLVMDVAPVNIDGRIMVPARFVAEALGATVSWDAATQTVVITSEEATVAKTAASTQADDWISVRDLVDQHAVTAVTEEADGLFHLRKGGVDAAFLVGRSGLSQPVTATVTGHSTITQITITPIDGRTMLHRTDAEALGWLP